MEVPASTQQGGFATTVMAQVSSLGSSWWCVTTRLTATLKWWMHPVPSKSLEKKSSKVININANAVKGEALRADIGQQFAFKAPTCRSAYVHR